MAHQNPDIYMTEQSDLRVTPFSTHWGTYYAEVQGGRLTGVRDYADDPDPAEIGPGIVDMVDHPTRISQPMIRQSYLAKGRDADPAGRGREPFVAVPWDEALDIAGAELQRVAQTHGNEAIFGGSYGWASAGRFHHAQSQVHRFLNCMGGYVASTNTYSHAAVDVLSQHIVGRFGSLLLDRATSWNSIVENTRLVVMFGGLPVKNAQITSGGVGRHTMPGALRAAKARGVEFVSISPIRSDVMPEIGAEWLAPRPNTDMAVMLGLAHTLVTEGLHDRNFLARYTVGFERFLPYLMGETDGQPKDAGWAAGISGLEARAIRALARRMAGTRTMISVAWSIQRADHGEMPCWMAVTLAAMLGQVGLPGGGFGIGYGSENGIGNPVRLFRFPALPQGQNPVAATIPVARISDALLHPGEPYDFNGEKRKYPDLRLVYWSGGNPFHHHQDLNRLVRAFRRPETIIVNDIWRGHLDDPLGAADRRHAQSGRAGWSGARRLCDLLRAGPPAGGRGGIHRRAHARGLGAASVGSGAPKGGGGRLRTAGAGGIAPTRDRLATARRTRGGAAGGLPRRSGGEPADHAQRADRDILRTHRRVRL
jgi:biotin/methionine sulfoxide reductase